MSIKYNMIRNLMIKKIKRYLIVVVTETSKYSSRIHCNINSWLFGHIIKNLIDI